MKKLIHNFLHCGIMGWCMEITYTALSSLRRRKFTLTGNTSIWMFPIYGSACLLAPLCKKLRRHSLFLRGFLYALLIFAAEYCTGTLLTKKKLCPWDYSRSKWHIGKVIRLDYLPCWFMAGLAFERLLSENESS